MAGTTSQRQPRRLVRDHATSMMTGSPYRGYEHVRQECLEGFMASGNYGLDAPECISTGGSRGLDATASHSTFEITFTGRSWQ